MTHNGERWILVVEDNLDDERLATRTFSKAGRSEAIRVARDGEEALELLRTLPPPNLLLLDLKLPRLSGMDVLTSVREDERLKTLPVVILTSSNEQSDVAACFGLGCNAFVRKSIDFNQYVDEFQTTIRFWLDTNCAPPIQAPEALV